MIFEAINWKRLNKSGWNLMLWEIRFQLRTLLGGGDDNTTRNPLLNRQTVWQQNDQRYQKHLTELS